MLDRTRTMLGGAIFVIAATGLAFWWIGCQYHDQHRIVAGSVGIAIGWWATRRT